MECAAHQIEADTSCARCERAICRACSAYEIEAGSSRTLLCDACGRDEEERSDAIGSAVIGFVGVGYLATLVVCIMVFKAKAFVGGIAAVAAIALGRILQLVMRPAVVVRRAPKPNAT